MSWLDKELSLSEVVSSLHEMYSFYESIDTDLAMTRSQRKHFDLVRGCISVARFSRFQIKPILLYTRAEMFLLTLQKNPASEYLRSVYEENYENSRLDKQY